MIIMVIKKILSKLKDKLIEIIPAEEERRKDWQKMHRALGTCRKNSKCSSMWIILIQMKKRENGEEEPI